MDDLFKKFLNTGVGFIAQGNKVMQTAIDKLVKESKLSEKEGQKIVADLLKSGKAKQADLEKQFMGLTETIRESVGMGADGKKKAPAAKAKAAPAAKPNHKPAAKPAAKKPASSATAKAAGTVKKAADSVSAAADTARRSAAAKAGAAKKKEAAGAKAE